MRSAYLEVESAASLTSLGLYQENSVHSFMTIESDSCSILENGNALNLFYCKSVDRTLHAINEDKDILLTGCLDTADVERTSSVLFALETGVLSGSKAKQFAIKRISKADC